MKKFVLVRHGQSEDNANQPSRGLGKAHLTEIGREQAQLTAAQWETPPDLIVHSPYTRTAQTAEPTIERFPAARVETWPIEEFRQLGYAHYEGKDMDYRRPLYGKYWALNDPDHVESEGAESIRQLAGRLDGFAEQLEAAAYETAYIFGHGYFLRAFMLRHIWGSTRPMLENIKKFRRAASTWHFPNCGLVHGRVVPSASIMLGQIHTEHLPFVDETS